MAVDPDVIPLGTHIMINDHEYIAEDVGGAVKGNVIDIYTADPSETMHYEDVYILEEKQ